MSGPLNAADARMCILYFNATDNKSKRRNSLVNSEKFNQSIEGCSVFFFSYRFSLHRRTATTMTMAIGYLFFWLKIYPKIHFDMKFRFISKYELCENFQINCKKLFAFLFHFCDCLFYKTNSFENNNNEIKVISKPVFNISVENL